MPAQAVTDKPQGLAQSYLDAWEAHDVPAIIALHTPDSVFTSVATGREAVGREAVGHAITEIFVAWPDIHFNPLRMYVTPELIVAESVAEAIQAVALRLGGEIVEPNGRRVKFAVADILAVEDGLVKRKDSYVDALGYLCEMRPR